MEWIGDDPDRLAYVLGGITALAWFVNTKARVDEGLVGKIGRIAVSLAVGSLVGGAVLVLLAS